ncbi:MAG: DUF2800 domain-containing protein [Shewanella sp.]|nr:DUF2800 domain-containing protein [Shewanella sp.]
MPATNNQASHAFFSPSKSDRWLKCPPSVKHELVYEKSLNKSAISGTHSHTLLEKCVKNNRATANDFIGQTLSDECGSFRVDQDRAQRVNVALTYVQKRLAESPSLRLECEIRLNLGESINMAEQLWGTADLILYNNEECEVIDYKDGLIPVSPKGSQLKLYAIGAATLQQTMWGKCSNEITSTIIQPKARILSPENDPIRHATFSSADLFDWLRTDVLKAMRQALTSDQSFVYGQHCVYCEHMVNCPAFGHSVLGDLPETPFTVTRDASLTDEPGKILTKDQIANLIVNKPLIIRYLENVEMAAKNYLLQDGHIEGLALKPGKTMRKWPSNTEAIVDTLKKMNMPQSVFYKRTLLTPNQLSRASWITRNGHKKTLRENQLAKVLRQAESIQSPPRVVPVTTAD